MQKPVRRLTPRARGRAFVSAGLALSLGLVAMWTAAPAARAVQETDDTPVAVASPAVDTELQSELSQSPVWVEFVERHGEWSVLWNERTGRPRHAVSRGYPLVAPGTSQNATEGALRSFVDQNFDVFGFEAVDLNLQHAVPNHRVQIFVFRQERDGIPVEGSQATFFVSHDGDLSFFELHQTQGRLPRPALPAVPSRVAQEILTGAVVPRSVVGDASLIYEDPELVFYPHEETRSLSLAWKVGIIPEAEPHHWVGYVDAETGDLIEMKDEVYFIDVEGHVDGRAHRDHPNSVVLTQDMPQIRVSVAGGGSAFADDDGDFVVSHSGSSPVSVSVGVVGRWARVDNRAGGEISDSATLTPGVPGTVLLNPSSEAEFVLAQIDAYLQVTKVHNFFKSVLPGATAIDYQATAYVNLNQNCNAFYNGRTNYYRAGSGCNNTAFASIVAHELGHEYDDRFGGIRNGGLSEGFGDILSMYLLGYPTIGPGFNVSGSGIRNGTNTRTHPATECGSSVHCQGEVWMGYCWQVRAALVGSLGDGPGAFEAEQAVIPTFVSNPGDQETAVLETFLLDDDNGDLSDGTPNFEALSTAAQVKRFDVPAPPVLTAVTPSVVGRCEGATTRLEGLFFKRGLAGNEVRIGGLLATVVDVEDTTLIRVEIPDLAPGTYNVSVTTEFGTDLIPNSVTIDEAPEVEVSRIRTGQTATISVCGAPNADFLVVASLRDGSEQFEGAQFDLGRRLYVLANSFSGSDAALDGAGEAEIPLPIPNNPNILFQTPKFQAAFFQGGNWVVSDVYAQTIFP